jgi:hypothetical protein
MERLAFLYVALSVASSSKSAVSKGFGTRENLAGGLKDASPSRIEWHSTGEGVKRKEVFSCLQL